PTGLANSSGELGRNLMDHPFGPGAKGTLPRMEERHPSGNRPNGIYVPRFLNGTDKHPQFVPGYGFQGGAARRDWRRGATTPGFGAAFKRALVEGLRPWGLSPRGRGEGPPAQ